MKAPREGTNVIKCLKKYFNCLQIACLQMRRNDLLQRLWYHVWQNAYDKAMRLDTSWKVYFERCLDWARGDGQTASFLDIEGRSIEAHQHVR